MPDPDNAKVKSFTAFRSAAEEADTKLANDVAKREEQSWDNEGGHMSSTSGRVTRASSADHPGHALSESSYALEQIEVAANRSENGHHPRTKNGIVVPDMIDERFGEEQLVGEAVAFIEEPARGARVGAIDG